MTLRRKRTGNGNKRILRLDCINGKSMEPTLGSGDWIVSVRSWSPLLRKGSLVLVDPAVWARGRLHALTDDTGSRLLLKRLVAKQGDVVAQKYLLGSEGIINVGIPQFNVAPQHPNTVPAGHVVVAGDRGIGLDSSVFGPVPYAAITHIVVGRMKRRRC